MFLRLELATDSFGRRTVFVVHGDRPSPLRHLRLPRRGPLAAGVVHEERPGEGRGPGRRERRRRRRSALRDAEAVIPGEVRTRVPVSTAGGDRKSTRLNSSHLVISYAVFC